MVEVEDFIQLISGKAFFFNNPSVGDVHIEDIAHTLSLLCRFGGHCKTFYSVAQHSVLCSKYATKQYKLEALLHDGGEAYLVDMPRPIKYSLPQYKELEKKIDSVVRKRFGLNENMSEHVKWIDASMLATEQRDLMNPSEIKWHDMPDPFKDKISPWSPEKSKKEFLKVYQNLV